MSEDEVPGAPDPSPQENPAERKALDVPRRTRVLDIIAPESSRMSAPEQEILRQLWEIDPYAAELFLRRLTELRLERLHQEEADRDADSRRSCLSFVFRMAGLGCAAGFFLVTMGVGIYVLTKSVAAGTIILIAAMLLLGHVFFRRDVPNTSLTIFGQKLSMGDHPEPTGKSPKKKKPPEDVEEEDSTEEQD